MSGWLESSGYTVVQTADGSEAWEITQHGDCPAIVVIDWDLSQASGWDLYRRIRQAHGPDRVYFIVAASQAEKRNLYEAVTAGANDFLSKPIRQDEFLARIRNAENVLGEMRHYRAMADTDPLTGLLNRRAFLIQGRRVLEAARSQASTVCCVMLDVDQFKRYNDDYGHAFGDDVLRVVADAMRRETRGTDLACRWGGDEFCVLLTGVSEDDAFEIAERIRWRITEQTAGLRGQPAAVESTAAVMTWTADLRTIEEWLEQTDRILLLGKTDGRNRTIRHSGLPRRRAATGGTDQQAQRRLLATTTVQQAVWRPIASLQEDVAWQQAQTLYLKSEVEFICVVNRAGAVVGIVTERDLLNAVIHGHPATAAVRSIMSYNFVSYSLNDPLIRVWETFYRTPALRRLVVDSENRPVGRLDIKPLLRWLLTATQAADFGQEPDASR